MVTPPEEEEFDSPNLHQMLDNLGGHDRKMKYPVSAIKSIALGNRFFLPRELRDINSKELEISLYEGYDKKLKRLVLEFIAENDIVCHLGLRQGLNSISFRKAKLIKLKEIDKYVLIFV